MAVPLTGTKRILASDRDATLAAQVPDLRELLFECANTNQPNPIVNTTRDEPRRRM